MSNNRSHHRKLTSCALGVFIMLLVFVGHVAAQSFDFAGLEQQMGSYTVIIDMKLELSFGIHTTEQQERYLGTIVTEDGLVLFNGAVLGANIMSGVGPFSIKSTPISIEVQTLDGKTFEGEYVGVDRFTRIGFLRIIADDVRFSPVRFDKGRSFRVGEWLTLYMLLPEFVSPPLASDVGMVSSVVESPEMFPLTVGFSPIQMTSVLFDETLRPVGVLGTLPDPSQAGTDAGGLIEGFGSSGIPLLGVIVGERLEKLIADPPVQGEPDRGWLGISLQALTTDMAEFWKLDIPGGIIVNDIVANSPAERSSLAVGDIIYEVNGQSVAVDKEEKLPVFQRMIAELGPGSFVELGVMRRSDSGTDTLKLFAELEKAPLAAAEAPTYELERLEIEVRNLVFADYLFHNQDPETFSGVVVASLKRGGLADIGGLRLGDIIQRIGNTPVESIEDVETVIQELEESQPREAIFFVWRNNKTLFVNVKTDWSP
ncbi:MAG: PDZ domain-containing protein [Candidatus Zixiibacteriota bacterium]